MLTSLGNRDFRLLWIGMTVSLLGDGVFLVALAWQVYELLRRPRPRCRSSGVAIDPARRS